MSEWRAAILADPTIWQIGAAEIIGVAAAVVSLVAAIVSWIYSSRAYKLAVAQEERKRAAISCTFHELRSYRDGTGGYVGLLVTISNTSENPNFVASAKLRAEYSVKGVPVALVIDASSRVGAHVDGEVGLACPVNLGGLVSLRGWLDFYLSEEMIGPVRQALEVRLVVTDSVGNQISLHVTAPRKFDDFSTKAESGSPAAPA
jgi:hypothetical protein